MNNEESVRRKILLAGGAGMLSAVIPGVRSARAATPRKKVKIGIITDLSGSNADNVRPSIPCCKQAIQDFGAIEKGLDVEVLVADHQNKVDVASSIARRWFDVDQVDCIVDVSTSSTALAVSNVVKEKDKILMVSGAATPLTTKYCNPNTVQWSYDTYMFARVTANAVLKDPSKSTWFFLAADYAFGKSMAEDAAKIVKERGGKVLGTIYYPFPGTTDFSSFLLQAQSSGAKVLALCQSGQDTVNCLKQVKEFGLDKSMSPVELLMYATEVHSLGLEIAQGLLLTETYYWDLNERTRSFMNRIKSKTPDNWPNGSSAGVYSDTLHYLKTIAAMGVDESRRSGARTIERMRQIPVDDDVFGKGWIREDGRMMHDVSLFRAKRPDQSKQPWDLLEPVVTVPAKDAFRPMVPGECKYVSS